MASVTISEASKLTGKARKTIYAHIKNGKVTSRVGKDKVRRIDTQELVRVYDFKIEGNTKVTPNVTPEVTTGNTEGNTINITSEQLELIVQTAVEKALLKVMPLLIEDKTIGANSDYMNGRTYTKNKDDYKQPKRDLTSSSGYMDNMSFLDKRFKR